MTNSYLEKLNNKLLQEDVSDDYYHACMKYASRLVSADMPVIFDLKHFSILTEIELSKLICMCESGFETSYHYIRMPKKHGGYREINSPSVQLKKIQRWVLDNIIDKMHCSNSATGFRKNTSIVVNAKRHLNKKCILNMDLKDFFPSISRQDVYRIFRYYGYTWQLSDFFADLCTINDALPQGAPTSPALSNVRCLKLDKRISKLCEKYRADYSRYADDITISSNNNLTSIITAVSEVIKDEGFTVNEKKTRVLFTHQKQEITGLIINGGMLSVPKEYKRKLRQEIYYCKKYGPYNHQKHVGDSHAFFKDHLYGKAYYIKMVEPEVGNQFLDELDEIKWDY